MWTSIKSSLSVPRRGDVLASLPLCMGIAIASGASGPVAGIGVLIFAGQFHVLRLSKLDIVVEAPRTLTTTAPGRKSSAA